MPFASIEEAAADIRAGRLVIIVDDESRENEGDLACAAECVTPEIINFMATHARGLICMPLTEERCDELHLTMQVNDNTSFFGTAFTVSVEARKGVTTGISASDRATTILTAVDPRTRPQDLARPGHVFPLRARPHPQGDARAPRRRNGRADGLRSLPRRRLRERRQRRGASRDGHGGGGDH
jgi:3,4-dihydroxy 2-butanone 4-phosphate synthase/GTP cyclohydrolase II